MPNVTAVEGPQRGASFQVHAGASVGRSRSCAVRLEGRHISRVHARFEPRGEALAIVDIDSRNGVFVNGTKVKDQVLKKDDEIEIGEHVLIFDATVAMEQQAAPVNGGAAKPTAAPPRQTGGTAVLDSIVNPFSDTPPDKLLAIAEAARKLAPVEDDKDVAKALLDKIMEVSKARRGFVMISDDAGRMKPLAKNMPEGDAEFYVSNVLFHQVGKERRAIIATDVARGGPNAGKPIAILSAPLVVGEAFIGFVLVDAPAAGTPPAPSFTRSDLQFAAGLCALSAPIIASARRAAKSRHAVRAIARRLEAEHPIVAGAGPMKEVADKLEPLALADSPVLLMGEIGTGKELVARTLHLKGSRAHHALVIVNAAHLAPAALDATLFGNDDNAGALEAPKTGVVYVAEIGALTPELQTKLLKKLEDRIAREGTGAPAEPRLVSGSSVDLESRVREGKFSKDLLAKLGTQLRLPPLRERKGDIAPLIAHVLRMAGRPCVKAEEQMTVDALAFFETHAWPGNVHELRNTLERMLLHAGGAKLAPEHLPTDLVSGDLLLRVRKLVKGDVPLTTLMADLEKSCLEESLRRTGGNKAAAADLVGVSRPTFLEKLKVYGLDSNEQTTATKPPS